MTFDWSEFHTFASNLATKPLTEVNARCAISRAYYAAFCSARNFMRDQDGDPKLATQGNVHDYVRRAFEDNSDKRRKKIGLNLKRLKINRQKADYDDIYQTGQQIVYEMRVSLSWAKVIIDELRTLPPQVRKHRSP